MGILRYVLPVLTACLSQATWVHSTKAGSDGVIDVVSNNMELLVKDKNRRIKYFRLSEAEPLKLELQGPATLELVVRSMRRHSTEGFVTVHVLGSSQPVATWNMTIPIGKAARIVKPFRGSLSPAVRGHMQIAKGKQVVELSLKNPKMRLAILPRVVSVFDPVLAFISTKNEEQTKTDNLASIPLEAVPIPAAAPVAATPVAAEAKTEALGIAQGGTAQRALAENQGKQDAEKDIQPVMVASADGTVTASTKALADAVSEGYEKLGLAEPFHRIAVPYFKELGDSASENHLGQLMAELLSVELSQREPFVLVERERLDQIMREHRLKDLGVVDEKSAAQFGRVLGAQSLISGTVAEAGSKYVVTVRQVEVETGKILVAGNIEMERGGLIALSSDAVVTRSKVGALFRSALVPGWGQFYNQELWKAATFAGAGIGTAGSALGFYVSSLSARSKYEKDKPKTVKQRKLANDRIQTANILLWSYAAIWAVNMLDAYFNGLDTTAVELPTSSSTTKAQVF